METAYEHNLDEKFIAGTVSPGMHNAPGLLKSLPLLNGKNVIIETILKGRKKGSLSVQEGAVEIVTTEFKRNHLHGAWKSRYSNGQLLDSGTFQNNIPTGEWRSWYSNGQLRSIRNYSSEKWYAVESEINRNNPRIYYYQLTKLVGFRWKNFESLTNSDASFSSLQDKSKYQPPYKYCLHHGLFMTYYSNGALKDSGYYKDGLRDGLWNEYYPNGQMSAQGSYFHGMKNGGWKLLNKDGSLLMLSEYRHGKLVHRKAYNTHLEQAQRND